MTRRKRCSLLVFLAGLTVLGGCAQPLKPMQFNNRMARANDRLASAAKKFYKALEPLARGNPPEGGLKSAYDECGSALREANADFADVKPPIGSATGAEVMEKYRAFLVQQQAVYDKCITPMYQAAIGPGDPVSKWQTIYPLLSRASAEERIAMAPLKNALTEFHQKHMLEPK